MTKFRLSAKGEEFIIHPQRNNNGQISTSYFRKLIIIHTLIEGVYEPSSFKDYIESLNILNDKDWEPMTTRTYKVWKHNIDAARQGLGEILIEKGDRTYIINPQNINLAVNEVALYVKQKTEDSKTLFQVSSVKTKVLEEKAKGKGRKKGGGPNLKKLFLDLLRKCGILVERYQKPQSKGVLFYINKNPCILAYNNGSFQSKFEDFYWGIGDDNLQEFSLDPNGLIILIGGRNFGVLAPEMVKDLDFPENKRLFEFIEFPPRLEYIFLFKASWFWNIVKHTSPDRDNRRNIHIYLKDHFKMTSEDITIEGNLVKTHSLNRFDRLNLPQDIQEIFLSEIRPMDGESEILLERIAEILINYDKQKKKRKKEDERTSGVETEKKVDSSFRESIEVIKKQIQPKEKYLAKTQENKEILEEMDKKKGIYKELELSYPEFSLEFYDSDYLFKLQNLIIKKKQIILYGPPGTGKTHLAIGLAQSLANYNPKNYQIIQFHPSYGYEDFIEGISIKNSSKNESFSYKIVPKIFRNMCTRAVQLENENKRVVLIIDEINRGDLGRIFGELVLGLEYRNIPIQTTYMEAPLRIPDNLLIIGTMNSVDRSIAIVDFALRRRFQFIKCMPKKSVLEKWLEHKNTESTFKEKILELFESLNSKIRSEEFKLGIHHQIGHVYFFVENQTEMERNWNFMIRPLLEEYLNYNQVAINEFDEIINEFS